MKCPGCVAISNALGKWTLCGKCFLAKSGGKEWIDTASGPLPYGELAKPEGYEKTNMNGWPVFDLNDSGKPFATHFPATFHQHPTTVRRPALCEFEPDAEIEKIGKRFVRSWNKQARACGWMK